MFQYGFSRIVVWLYIWLIVNYFCHKLSGLIRGTKGAPLRGACIIFGAGGDLFRKKAENGNKYFKKTGLFRKNSDFRNKHYYSI